MNAANEKRGLSVLVLQIRFHTAPDQKLHDVFSVGAAGHVERGGQLCIDEVGLGARALEQQHEHLSVAELRRLVQHGVTEGVIHVVLLDLVLVEEAARRGQVISLNGPPKSLMQPLVIFFKVSCNFVIIPCFLFSYLLELA